MASQSVQSLQVPQSVSTGTWLPCQGLGNKTVHVFGTFTATLQVQYTVGDDAEPINLGAALTTPGYVQVPMVVKKVRINTTAYTSGTPKAALSAEE
jgi:hypothetical protein